MTNVSIIERSVIDWQKFLPDKMVFQDLFTMLVLSLTIFALILAYNCTRRNMKLPPGPWGLPFFGYLQMMKNSQFHLELFDLSQQHGKLISVKMGQETMVVISDHRLIKKAFQSKYVNSRPKNAFSSLMGGYGKILNPYK